jgi:hypothetical protein
MYLATKMREYEAENVNMVCPFRRNQNQVSRKGEVILSRCSSVGERGDEKMNVFPEKDVLDIQ